jgi:hypothetical protein
MPKLFVPFICYNHTANTEWMMSMMRLILTLRNMNIDTVVYPIFFDSLISRARNAAVAAFLSEEDATHLLFVDSDIEFTPEDVLKLLHADQPVVAAGYPQKWLSEETLRHVLSKQPIPTHPLELCTKPSVHLLPKQPIAEVMEAEYATTGFLLIRRAVFESLKVRYPERQYTNDVDAYQSSNPDEFFDFFAVSVHPETRRLESEDYGFSRLWRGIGGKIHIVTNITLTHHGWYGYKNNLYQSLQYASST